MTNTAYEATNSDVEKLIAPYESKFSRLWERFDEACHGNAEHMRDILETTLNALEGAESDIAVLTSALEQAQQYSKKRDEENQDLMLTIGRLRVEREQLESAPHHNGMMQLSNELAEMKRKCVEVPDDWELAPSRPTQRMLAAGYQAYMKGPHNGRFYRTYQAMLSVVGTVEGE